MTEYCKPDNPDDFMHEHPGQWQNGIEDGIPWIFGQTMDEFRDAFNEWVRSIDICNTQTDLFLPITAKYLTFNYTETLENVYGVPAQNVLHIHGSRLEPDSLFVIGHGNLRDKDAPYNKDELLLPYQNAYSEVIRIMNGWRKDPKTIIRNNESFFQSLNTCKGVCVMGVSYNGIDMPYLYQVLDSVNPSCKWVLYFYSNEDQQKAKAFARDVGLEDCEIKYFI